LLIKCFADEAKVQFLPVREHVLIHCKILLLPNARCVLREERRLRVFENRVLRGIFGPKTDEVRGERRKLHNEELHDLYCSPNIVQVIKSKIMRWAGACSADGGGERCVKGLVGKPE
jgi:hypothetical protein